ncbi:CapA family protein [Thermodesulfobacteriota bacterium]
MSNESVTLMGVGDMVFRGPNPESIFNFVAPVLRTADIVIGQVETPYTKRPTWTNLESSGTAGDPDDLCALTYAGFNIVTLAGNHLWDAGLPGMEDTMGWLREHDIAFVGAGMNIDEARKPVIMERNGIRVGFLDYNCTGPKEGWASIKKPGCAYVHIITHYELDHSVPGGPPRVYTWAETESVGAMVDDISKLRPLCDVLVVCFHKGIIHTPMKLAEYESPVSYAAIDAGADLILAEHQHVLQGVEFYKGKAIFHGLSNFTGGGAGRTKVRHGQQSRPGKSMRHRELYDFEPDPLYSRHPEAIYTIIAKCTIDDGKVSRLSYLPCLFNPQGQLELLKHDERGQEVFDYMDKITRGVNLNAQYEWEGDEIVISS